MRLIEEERKKRDTMTNQSQNNNSDKDPLNSTITTTITNYTSTNKNEKPSNKPSQQQTESLPMIVQPSSQPVLTPQPQQQQQDNKKSKKKLKLRKIQGQSDDESTYKNMNVTPSGVKPVISEENRPLQTINTNTVTLPKIGGGHETHDNVSKPVKERNSEKEKNKEKIDNHTLRKLKRQISNAKHISERYEILKTLGDGNFAVVKQAKLRSTDNEYAIKIIDKSKMKVRFHFCTILSSFFFE